MKIIGVYGFARIVDVNKMKNAMGQKCKICKSLYSGCYVEEFGLRLLLCNCTINDSLHGLNRGLEDGYIKIIDEKWNILS